MTIKTEVTPEEKALIQSLAKAEGKSVSAYLKSKALANPEIAPEHILKCIDIQSEVAKDINRIVTTSLRNKAIFEAEILELLKRMTALEEASAVALKEARRHGNTRKQKHQRNSPGGS